MSLKYFNTLNYTLANEDTAFELELLREGAGHVFCVAGSGGRALPLLAKKPEILSCVDVAKEQLYLAELRFESVRALDHAEFLAFWGYPPCAAEPSRREELFAKIKLTDEAKSFFLGLFEEKKWESILYEGKWERTFAKLAFMNRKLTGAKGLEFFSAQTEAEHERFMAEEFPAKAWKAVLFLLGNAGVFNALLYKGHFPKKNIPDTFYRFYEKCFDRLFHQGPARRNFFLQVVFFGKVMFAEGCPIECDPKVFAAAKQALKTTEIRYCLGDLLSQVERSPKPIDFLSFSDVPSYFKDDVEKNFLQRVAPKMAPGGLAIVRNYLHVPEGLDTAGYDVVTDQYADAIAREKVGVYLIDVYRRRAL